MTLTCLFPQVPLAISVNSGPVLQAAAAAASNAVRALLIDLWHGNAVAAVELLQGCTGTCLRQLHTLALEGRGDATRVGPVLESLALLLESGQLPALKMVMAHFQGTRTAGLLQAWRPFLVQLLRAGCSVHLLPDQWDACAALALQELRVAVGPLDPDRLLLGLREEVHSGQP